MLTIPPNENTLTYQVCDQKGLLFEITQEQITILRMAKDQGYEPTVGFNLVLNERKLLIAVDEQSKNILLNAIQRKKND